MPAAQPDGAHRPVAMLKLRAELPFFGLAKGDALENIRWIGCNSETRTR